MAKPVYCAKHDGLYNCYEGHAPQKLIEIIGENSLVNLATWILKFGDSNQVAFVKGQLANI